MSAGPHETLKIVDLVLPISQSPGSITSTAISTRGFEEALIVVGNGTIGSSGTLSVLVQESDSSTTGFTSISGAVFGDITPGNDRVSYVGRIRCGGRDRYLNVLATLQTATSPVHIYAILCDAKALPVTQDATVAFNVTA